MSSTPIIWCPLAVSPIASVNAPLFFLFLSFSLGLALVWTLFLHTQLSTISVSGEDSRPKHQSGFVAQFHGGNSIHFQMEICSVFPSSRHAMYRPTHQRTVQIGFAFQFFFFSSLYLLKLRLFFFFFFKIEICGFPPQNAIAFISFPFFCETGKIPIICKMWARLPASFYTRYTGLCWMQQKSAPMRIGKPV